MRNLKPFKKGQSGNPAGRPKIPALNLLLAECCTEAEMKKVIKALLAKAKDGNIRACEVVLDRLYGKAVATIDFKNDSEPQRYDFSKLSTPTLEKMAEVQKLIEQEMKEHERV